MENNLSIQTTENVLCNSCYVKVNLLDTFCNNCGYPLKGTEEEQQTFINNRSILEIDMGDYKKNIKEAGIALYWIAGSCVFSGIIYYFTKADDETKFALLIINLIIAMIYIALGSWSKKKPLAAILSGATLYGLMIILNLISDPKTIAQGFILKIIVIGAFIKGVKSAMAADKMKKEFNIQ